MPTEAQRLQHALHKLIPDVKQGCVINTAAGDLFITGRDAIELGNFLQGMYERKLRTAMQIEGCTNCGD